MPRLETEPKIEAAVAVGYGGLEGYGFHALETLQCMIERRQQGESGIAEVQTVRGDQIVAAVRQRAWLPRLLESALQTMPGADLDSLAPAVGLPRLLQRTETLEQRLPHLVGPRRSLRHGELDALVVTHANKGEAS